MKYTVVMRILTFFLILAEGLFGQTATQNATWFVGSAGKGLWQVDRSELKSSPKPLITIISQPDGADIFRGEEKIGQTPLTSWSPEAGGVSLELRKSGYFPMTILLNAESQSSYILTATMEKAYAVIKVTPFSPRDELYANGYRLEIPNAQVSAGLTEILIRRFGFQDIRKIIVLQPEQVLELNPVWIVAPFQVEDQGTRRRVLAPGNPGDLGSFRWDFEVTAPGSGTFRVTKNSAPETTVFELELGPFQTWNQTCRWTPPESQEAGEYSASIFATGSDQIEVILEYGFVLDPSQRFRPLLGQAPLPQILPTETLQIGWLSRFVNSINGAGVSHDLVFRAGFPALEFQAGLGFRVPLASDAGEWAGRMGIELRPWELVPKVLRLGWNLSYRTAGKASELLDGPSWAGETGARTSVPLLFSAGDLFEFVLEPGFTFLIPRLEPAFSPRGSVILLRKETTLSLSGVWSSADPGIFRVEADAAILPYSASVLIFFNGGLSFRDGQSLYGSLGLGLGFVF